MEKDTFVCWKCGQPINDLSLPISRTDYCPSCRAELHVCHQCHFYNPKMAHQCYEPIAEQIDNKERANFCGYFQLSHTAHHPPSNDSDHAKVALDNLFEGSDQPVPSGSTTEGDSKNALEALFKPTQKSE